MGIYTRVQRSEGPQRGIKRHRRPGEPFRVYVGPVKPPEDLGDKANVDVMIRMNEAFGNKVYATEGWWCTDVLTYDMCYRASDAVFHLRSGLYIFKD